MFNIFGKGQAVPTRVTSDRVNSLHFFDDTPVWRSFILYSMFVFDDVLDAERLHSGLEGLVKREGWHKLGARLRRNSKGQLEYHIPEEFTKDRPAISYTHVEHNMKKSDHAIASRLPHPSSRPAVVADPDEFQPLFRCEGGPTKLDDYVNADMPQLGLYILSFTDATIVSLYWPHTLFDAMGKKALLTAWSLTLQGREDEVLPPFGTDSDPFTELGKHQTEAHMLSHHRISSFGLIQYGLCHIVEFMWRSQENRMVCVPGSFVEKLRNEALQELAEETDSSGELFLSEGDVLCAWWTRLAISHLPQDSNMLVVLNNAYSLRPVLEGDLIPEGRAYLSNAIGFINVLLVAKDIVEKPLSYVASRIRKSITQLGTREQVEAFTAMVRESGSKLPPFFGDSSMHMITFSNWHKARLFELDFSSAIVRDSSGASERRSQSGHPTYIQNNQFGLTLPNGFPIIGKDTQGNYWLSGYMNKGHWGKIEEILAKLEDEHWQA
ncbi:Fc.00g073860.m01.CDS01 [Cosmosporella sp. VM-42]